MGYLHINIWYHQLDTLILSFVSIIGDSYYNLDPNYVQGLRGNLMLTKLSDSWKKHVSKSHGPILFKKTWTPNIARFVDLSLTIILFFSFLFCIKNKVIMCPNIFWHHMVVSMGVQLVLIHFILFPFGFSQKDFP